MVKHLILMRHAEAQPLQFVKNDRDRALSGAGLKQLDSVSEQIAQKLSSVDYVLCSNARRTRQTLDGIQRHLSAKVEISFEDKLYGASAAFLLERIRRINDGYQCALLVGHNPGLQDFLFSIGKNSGLASKEAQTCSVSFLEAPEESWFPLHMNSLKLMTQILPEH